ncbi:hypothetical protein MRX96_010077 [Rhipicephalus microplus]
MRNETKHVNNNRAEGSTSDVSMLPLYSEQKPSSTLATQDMLEIRTSRSRTFAWCDVSPHKVAGRSRQQSRPPPDLEEKKSPAAPIVRQLYEPAGPAAAADSARRRTFAVTARTRGV